MAKRLLDAVIIDTVGTAIEGIGGQRIIQVSSSNFGGGSVTIEGRLDSDLEWTTLTYGGNPAVFTTKQILKLDFWAATMQLRATLSGSTGATAVTVVLSD
jgi:hypothetical protein